MQTVAPFPNSHDTLLLSLSRVRRHHRFMDLSTTLRPRSIAVVGASPRSFAGSIVQRNCNAHAFTGTVTPINGKYDQIEGVGAVPTLLDLEDSPDVVVALVGTSRVLGVAEEAGAIGAGSLIVPGGGFTDSGAEASELADGLAQLADKFQMSIVGPNCMGIADLVTGAIPTSEQSPVKCGAAALPLSRRAVQ